MNKTHVVMVIDESGSMSDLRDDVIGAFNTFLEEQKNLSGKCRLSIIKFNSIAEPSTEYVKIQKVSKWTSGDYTPGGMTALYDAIGRGIELVLTKPVGKMVIMVQTDGHENSSREFNHSQIRALIENNTDVEVVFLGANIDAELTGGNMGLSYGKTMNMRDDAVGVHAAYESVSENLRAYRVGEKTTMDFEDKDREKQKKDQ